MQYNSKAYLRSSAVSIAFPVAAELGLPYRKVPTHWIISDPPRHYLIGLLTRTSGRSHPLPLAVHSAPTSFTYFRRRSWDQRGSEATIRSKLQYTPPLPLCETGYSSCISNEVVSSHELTSLLSEHRMSRTIFTFLIHDR